MGRDFSFQWQLATYLPMGWDGEIGHGTSLQNITFSYLFNHEKQLKLSKNKHILTTTKVGFLSRVLFKQMGRTCLLIGSDQPKVVLPYLFGMCGLINSGMIINVNCIIVDTIPNFSQSWEFLAFWNRPRSVRKNDSRLSFSALRELLYDPHTRRMRPQRLATMLQVPLSQIG